MAEGICRERKDSRAVCLVAREGMLADEAAWWGKVGYESPVFSLLWL